MLPTPRKDYHDYLIGQDRDNLSKMVQFLTGHNYLKYHMYLTSRATDDKCRLCMEDRETSWHLLTECPMLLEARQSRLHILLVDELPSPGKLRHFLFWPRLRELLDQTDHVGE